MCGSSRRQRGHEARKVIVLGEDGTDAYLERGPEDAELDERHGGERYDDDVELGVKSRGG